MTQSLPKKILALCAFLSQANGLYASDFNVGGTGAEQIPFSQRRLPIPQHIDLTQSDNPFVGSGAASMQRQNAFLGEEEAQTRGLGRMSGRRHSRSDTNLGDLDLPRKKVKTESGAARSVKVVESDDDSSSEDVVPVKKRHKKAEKQSQFFSHMKKTIEPFIKQVVKITVSSDNVAHTGTGWIFDAANGVIATNLHVATTDFVTYQIKMQNGKVYRGKDIEILGLTTSQSYGDFAFLRIADLAGKFEQMPMVTSHSVVKHDPVAFMGNSLGHFSVEEGNLNGLYDFALDKTMHSIQVQLVSHGGASGSPTFNREGLINGILFGGDTAHTLICPLWHLQKAYAQITAEPGILRPVVTKTLGSLFDTIELSEVADYRKIDEGVLTRFIPDDQREELKFIMFTRRHSVPGFDAIQPNDILLTVNGENIGCDTIKLTTILDQNEVVTIQVVRDLNIITLPCVMPRISRQAFPRRIVADEHDFIEITSNFHRTKFPIGGVAMVGSGATVYDIDSGDDDCDELVDKIGSITVRTFEDVARALYNEYVRDKNEHMIVSTLNEGGNRFGTNHLDFTGMGGQSFIVHLFNFQTRHWEKKRLEEYVVTLPGGTSAGL